MPAPPKYFRERSVLGRHDGAGTIFRIRKQLPDITPFRLRHQRQQLFNVLVIHPRQQVDPVIGGHRFYQFRQGAPFDDPYDFNLLRQVQKLKDLSLLLRITTGQHAPDSLTVKL